MNLKFSFLSQGGAAIFDDDEFVGHISQIPDDGFCSEPGKWQVSVLTKDRLCWYLGNFEEEEVALGYALTALRLKRTYHQWNAISGSIGRF